MQSAQGAISLRSVSFAIVFSRRYRLGDSFAQHASDSLHPAQRALRLRALLMEGSHEHGLSPSSPPQEFSLRSVRFAIVTWLRYRLPGSFAPHASASLYPAQRALRLRASESAMNERSSYNCALRKLRVLSQSDSRFRFPQPRRRPFACFPAGLPGAFSHRACSGRTAND